MAGVRAAQHLYHKILDFRDAIAHFLIEREGADIHVYLAEGAQLYGKCKSKRTVDRLVRSQRDFTT